LIFEQSLEIGLLQLEQRRHSPGGGSLNMKGVGATLYDLGIEEITFLNIPIFNIVSVVGRFSAFSKIK
jgi:hypothetical protein